MTISGLFSANYNNIFHKNGVQTNIFKCLTYTNPNWIKSYNTKHIVFHFRGFSILEKNENLPLINNGHFTTISDQLNRNPSQN